MNQLVRISDYRRKGSALHFTRSELTQLLAVYSSRVITGEWRDYAIGATPAFARFCIYRSSREEPLFTVTKLATEGKARSSLARKGKYVVSTRHRTLRQSNSLLNALEIFRSELKLVPH
ncbi:MAG: DUF2794 domain-containing protein [Rhodospirillaceae bacterium]|nr:DUF2794 domain-containing protein [Rhodospirillaceae bacterium]